MVGSEEGIVSKDAINQFCKGSINCTIKTWKGLFHELHNEPEKQDVTQFAVDWLTKQL